MGEISGINTVKNILIPNNEITEAKLNISDNTTKNASTTAHGFLKKLSNVATQVMTGDGNWTAISTLLTYKDVKTAFATWTSSQNIATSTPTDITNATVTISGLDSSKTYHLFAEAVVPAVTNNTNDAISSVDLLIDSTLSNTGQHAANASGSGTSLSTIALSGAKSVTGATSYIIKLQGYTSAGTGVFNGNTKTGSIKVTATEQ